MWEKILAYYNNHPSDLRVIQKTNTETLRR